MGQIAVKPGLGKGPMAPHGALGDTHEIGNDRLGKSGEEPEFNNSGGFGVVKFEAIERGGNVRGVDGRLRDRRLGGSFEIQIDPRLSAAAFEPTTGTRVIDEHLAHGVCGNSEEPGTLRGQAHVFKRGGCLTGTKLQIHLVNQSGRIQRVTRTLVRELAARE